MAGKEKRGASAADADLFRGRTWILTPDDPEELRTSAALEFREWLERIGARVLTLDADEHDRVVSLTSHLAQLASTALAATVADKLGEPARLGAAGPGLEDMTRLALSSYEIWRDILATNSDHIERALGVLYSEAGAHAREPAHAPAAGRIRTRRRTGREIEDSEVTGACNSLSAVAGIRHGIQPPRRSGIRIHLP